jgi:hypothetical protein
LQSTSFVDNDGNVGMRIGFKDFGGGVLGAHGEVDGDFQQTASIGLEGLYQPFSTSTTAQTNMPHRETPRTGIAVTSTDLNAFDGTGNLLWAAHGAQYAGMFLKQGSPDWNNMRVLGLKAPIYISGWGYDLCGKPVPNSNEDPQTKNMTSSFLTDYKKKPDKFKSGPLDVRWNRYASKWVSPGGCLFGTWAGSSKLSSMSVQLQ